MDPFGQGPVAPSATPNSILQILGGLSARDPSAANPATTAAMAKSRDAITRILERQLARQEAPFTGLNDVATAATAALASGGRTPFGMTLERLDQDRSRNTANIAGTLSNVAAREQRGGIDPIRAASLVMRHIEQQSRNGDRDAREVDSFVKSLASNMEPASALRFQTSYGQAIAEHVQKTGANPDPRELKMLISDFAQRGGFQTKLPMLQQQINPITGEKVPFNPNPYGTGRVVAGTSQPPPTGRVDPGTALSGLPPAGTRLPNEFSGPPLGRGAPGADFRAQAAQAPAQQPQRVPLPPPAQGIPPVISQPQLKAMPDTERRLGTILRARDMAQDVPQALGFQGALIDTLGGLGQQLERAIGAPGALGTEKYKVNEVSKARDQFNLLFSELLPTITGDQSGRYSNFDVQLAKQVARFKSSVSSVEQSVGFLTLLRDMEIRTLRRQLVLSGPAGRSVYETFSPEVKQAMENPAIVGQDGDAPYDDIKLVGTKVYVRMKGTTQWSEVQR